MQLVGLVVLLLMALLAPVRAESDGAISASVTQRAVLPPLVRQQGKDLLIGLLPDHFELPMMWSTRMESANMGAGFNGLPISDSLVRFEQTAIGEVLLREIGVRRVGTGEAGQAAQLTDSPRLIAIFQPTADQEDGRVWLNLTPQLMGFGPNSDNETWWKDYLGLLSAPSLIDNLCRPVEARQRPDAAQFRVELSFSASSRIPALGGGDPGHTGTLTARVLHNVMPLWDEPMAVRVADPRVGFISVPVQQYGDQGARLVSYAARFWLGTRRTVGGLTRPPRPIVFHLAPEVPTTWRPAIRAGIMDWVPALEAAGYPKAIEVRDEPPEPDWNPADPRFNVVRWIAHPVANAIGRPALDPRTGEILSASLILWSGVLNHFSDQYRASVGGSDPRNAEPADSVLRQEILRYVVSHETGHALGLLHNHKAASAYPLAALRNLDFTRRFGTSASIMSYGRFNHLGRYDGRPGGLVPRLGPYDFYAIRWGYSAEERSASEAWVPDRPSIDVSVDRLLEFSSDEQVSELDAQAVRESIGDDRAASAAEALARLRWTWQRVGSAAVSTPQELDALRRQFQAALDQRSHILRSLVRVVGGMVESRRLALSSPQPAWVPVPATEQREALALLMRIISDDAQHIEITQAAARLQAGQPHAALVASYKLAFTELLQPLRLAQLKSLGAGAPSVDELLEKLQGSLFSASASELMNPVRLELQSMYLGRLRALLDEPQVVPLLRASGLSAEVPSSALDLAVDARLAADELLRNCRVLARTHRSAEVRRYYGSLVKVLSASTLAGAR